MSQELVRSKGGVTYRCRPAKNGKWYIHWSEGRRSRRASTGQSSSDAADIAFDEWLKFEGVVVAGESQLTCAEIWDEVYPAGEFKFHRKNVMSHFGSKKLAEVTDDLEDEYIELRATGKIGRKPAAPGSILTELALMRGTWTRAARKPHKIIASADIPRLQPLPSPSKPRERWLTEDEIVRLLQAARDYAWPRKHRNRLSPAYRFVWLLLETAGRRDAVAKLRWEQIDLEAGVIHLNPSGRAQTRKRRASVPISRTFRPILERMHRERVSPWLLDEPQTRRYVVQALAKRAGIDGATAHTLRHTAATRLARSGVELWIIANLLGNTVRETEKTYAKFHPSFAQAAVDGLPTDAILKALDARSG